MTNRLDTPHYDDASHKFTLAVIIVNYNVKYFVEQCLISLQKAMNGINGEVYVVDNASTDGSVEYLIPRFPDVHLLIPIHLLLRILFAKFWSSWKPTQKQEGQGLRCIIQMVHWPWSLAEVFPHHLQRYIKCVASVPAFLRVRHLADTTWATLAGISQRRLR